MREELRAIDIFFDVKHELIFRHNGNLHTGVD
jgi:hypothetical protein